MFVGLFRCGLRRGWSLDILAPRYEPGSDMLQPVAEPYCRDAVVAVVSFDDAPHLLGDVFLLTVLQPQFQCMAVDVCLSQLNVPCVAVELLEVLDRIPLDARPERLPRCGEQVNEEFGAQYTVYLVLAGRVPPHEALERTRFVRSEVVDVEVGMLRPAGHDRIDERLEDGSLSLREARRVASLECPL